MERVFLLLILMSNGFIWARSSYGKVNTGTFVDGLGATLTRFADKNPYPWFKSFLQSVAIPNSQIFGQLVFWGELLVALSLTLGILYLIFAPKAKCGIVCLAVTLGLFGGVLMNLFFWLAAGYTSPSTDGLNLVMFITQLIGLVYFLKLQKA